MRRDGQDAKHPEGVRKDFHDRVMDKALEYIRAELARKETRDTRAPGPLPIPDQARLQPAMPLRTGAVAADRQYRNSVR